MSRLRVLYATLALDLCLGVVAQDLRAAMLAEARQRIGVWHGDKSLLEPATVKDGISLTMLKHDLTCGEGRVPVGFGEFEVPGARPVDVFNTVMDVAAQPNWNKKCDSMEFVGNWAEEGARGWDNVFNLIFDKKLEFLVWQVADADFEREEFWMVTSTKHNSELREKSPKRKNWIESHNCLGAYHISKSASGGARVVVTQHVDTPFSLFFPFHEILKVFPFAWQGMLNFIEAVGKQSVTQRALGWSANRTMQPQWLLKGPAPTGMNARVNVFSNGTPVMVFSEEPSAMPQTTSQRQWLRIAATSAFVVLIMCCCLGVFGLFHCLGRRKGASCLSRGRSVSECGSALSGSARSHRSIADLSEFDSENGWEYEETQE